MPNRGRKLLLVTGIPGTGKTCYGKLLAQKFGFVHYDLEAKTNLDPLLADPAKFMDTILEKEGDVVATWGFLPNDEQIQIVNQFQARGFTLVWFDGNRPAALREFINRGDVPEENFYLQM
jgi:adenylate kinase family enzyme